MFGRILMTWRVVGRTFGMWAPPAVAIVLFLLLRAVNAVGMVLDHVFFPRLARTRVVRPIVIVGNPRSGTTFLHRFLSDHGFGQGMQLWRMVYPSLTVQTLLRPFLPWLEKVSPARFHASAAHQTSLTGVETDDAAILLRFVDGMFWYSFFLAFDEVDRRDLVDPRKRDTSARDFAWMEKLWRRNLVATGASTVIAKVFTLSARLPEFLRKHPDARILYMVRDPVSTMPSTMSLVTGPLDAAFGFWSRPEEVRQRYLSRLYDGVVELYRGFHDDWTSGRIPRDKVFLVRYDRMMKDFDGLMEEMMEFLGEPVDDALRAEIARIAEKQRNHVSKHRYSLEKFGLDEERIRRDLAFVYETFLPPLDGPADEATDEARASSEA